jgi:hypothetical protein
VKTGAMLIGVLVGIVSLLFVGIYGGLLGGGIALVAEFAGQSQATGRTIQVLSVLVPSLAIIGGGICAGKPKIGVAILIIAAVAHASFLESPIGDQETPRL